MRPKWALGVAGKLTMKLSREVLAILAATMIAGFRLSHASADEQFYSDENKDWGVKPTSSFGSLNAWTDAHAGAGRENG